MTLILFQTFNFIGADLLRISTSFRSRCLRCHRCQLPYTVRTNLYIRLLSIPYTRMFPFPGHSRTAVMWNKIRVKCGLDSNIYGTFIWDAYNTLTTLYKAQFMPELSEYVATYPHLPSIDLQTDALDNFRTLCQGKSKILVVPWSQSGRRGKLRFVDGQEACRLMCEDQYGIDMSFVDPEWRWVCMRTHEQYTDMRIGPFLYMVKNGQ